MDIIEAIKNAATAQKLSGRVRARLHRYKLQDGLLLFEVVDGVDPRWLFHGIKIFDILSYIDHMMLQVLGTLDGTKHTRF